MIIFHDVSQSRSMVLKMTHQARHDLLTDLPNRALLAERLSQAIGLAQRHRKQVALLFVDLDDFKYINDAHGHAVGDQLLQSVAERMVACVRATDTVCRQGGDEFVILLTEIEHPRDAAQVAEKLSDTFGQPKFIGGQALRITLSIGISVNPNDGDNMDSMMRNADAAMYDAKADGGNHFRFFRPALSAHPVRHASKSTRPALQCGRHVE